MSCKSRKINKCINRKWRLPSNKAAVVLAWRLSGVFFFTLLISFKRERFLTPCWIAPDHVHPSLLFLPPFIPLLSLSQRQLSPLALPLWEKLRSSLNKLSRRVVWVVHLINPGVETTRDILSELSPEWHWGSGAAMLTRSAESQRYLGPLSISSLSS